MTVSVGVAGHRENPSAGWEKTANSTYRMDIQLSDNNKVTGFTLYYTDPVSGATYSQSHWGVGSYPSQLNVRGISSPRCLLFIDSSRGSYPERRKEMLRNNIYDLHVRKGCRKVTRSKSLFGGTRFSYRVSQRKGPAQAKPEKGKESDRDVLPSLWNGE